jgi:hypothetical protein
LVDGSAAGAAVVRSRDSHLTTGKTLIISLVDVGARTCCAGCCARGEAIQVRGSLRGRIFC